MGKLICQGKKSTESKPSTCSALKTQGVFQSGFYNIKAEGEFSRLVFCDMTNVGYNNNENNGEEFIESSESHFVEMDETIGEIVSKVEVIFKEQYTN